MKWIFNSYMVWGAILGSVMFLSVQSLIDTANHKGPGYVHYGDGVEPDFSEKVSEEQYKRSNYTMGVFMLCISVGLWLSLAYHAKKNEMNK